MRQNKKMQHTASGAHLYATQPPRKLVSQRAGALLMGTALSAVIGLGYGRGAYAQTLSGSNEDTVLFTGPGTFVTEDGFSVDTTVTDGSGGDGIKITTPHGQAGDTTFTDIYSSAITGDNRGIYANNSGSGALKITTTGRVLGQNEDGIEARNYGANLTISAANVTDGVNGIYANNRGSGALRITTTGAANGRGIHGISAFNGDDATDLTIDATDVTGYIFGISAYNRGSGALRITATGAVTGRTVHGIRASNSNDSTDLIIEAVNVIGTVNGIYADNKGSGALAITTTENVTGQDVHGIFAENGNLATDLSIEAANLTGKVNGIYANNRGSGALRITTTGAVTGRTIHGISAFNSNDATDLTIEATNVIGKIHGINALNQGRGALSITATGTVTGTAADGIYANNSRRDLTILANEVTGGRYGIDARNQGSGVLSITATGTVTGTGKDGISAYNQSSGTDLRILAKDVSGGSRGISAKNYGSGALSITATGTVTGTAGESSSGEYGSGISADNGSSATDLTISANEVTGGSSGIEAGNGGSGALSITTTGVVTGATQSGINAYNRSLGTDLTISANEITGSYFGIYADNAGRGALSITATGVVTGAGQDGINAYNRSSGTNLAISANEVIGNAFGIFAINEGSGALSISTSGDVTGTDSVGIRARNSSSATHLTIAAREVTGGSSGIEADNRGSGALSIATTGVVTGAGQHGIRAFNSGTGLTISANEVTGQVSGINAENSGSGALLITATGAVTGSEKNGIEAYSSNTGTDLTISAKDVTGSDYGIVAYTYGSGALSITATGTVIGTGEDGINADNSDKGTDLTILANEATGSNSGIYADNDGSGALSITANGAVTGETDDGIYANNASTKDLTITINEGGSVSTLGTDDDDFAIEALAPKGAVIVKNFGKVTGRVNLSNSNLFTNSGTWDLASTTSDFNASGDSTVANAGLIIAASDGAVDEISAIDNLDIFRNNVGGTIRLADGAAGDVFLINGDTEAPADVPGTFLANGGTIELDVILGGDGSDSDFLAITGNVTLGDAPTALVINTVGGGTGGATNTGIGVVNVEGMSEAGTFVLAAPVEVGALSYDLSLGQCDDTADQNWYLCNNGTIGTTGAVFEAMPGVVLNAFARTDTLEQRLGARVQGGNGTTLSTPGEADLPVAQAVGSWMRTWGDFADITPDNSTAGTSWEADSWGLEAGIGTILGDHAGGKLVGGMNLRYGATYADLSNPVGTASLNAEGFGAAASLTWFGNDGFYVDGNAAMDFVYIDATSQGGGELLNDHDEVVYSASAEVGQRIELEGGTTLVPQAQLSWGKMRDGSLTDNLGNVVSFADRETLTSRFGLTVEQDVTDPAWGSGKVYGFSNVLHDLKGSRSVTVAGTNVTQSGTGDWVELGGGFSLLPTESTNLFGQVSYREAFNGVDGDAIAVSAGWKMQW